MPASESSQRTVCAWAAEPRIAITPSNGNARTRGRDERDTGCRRASARQNRKRKSERARRIALPILRGFFRGLLFALHQLKELGGRILGAELIEFLRGQRERRIDRFLRLFSLLIRAAYL